MVRPEAIYPLRSQVLRRSIVGLLIGRYQSRPKNEYVVGEYLHEESGMRRALSFEIHSAPSDQSSAPQSHQNWDRSVSASCRLDVDIFPENLPAKFQHGLRRPVVRSGSTPVPQPSRVLRRHVLAGSEIWQDLLSDLQFCSKDRRARGFDREFGAKVPRDAVYSQKAPNIGGNARIHCGSLIPDTLTTLVQSAL